MKTFLISFLLVALISSTFGGSQIKKVFESEILELDAR